MESDPELRRLIDRVLAAGSRGAALAIRGGGTKAFYGEAPRGEPLEIGALSGISSYEPSELVVTARAGTPLSELEAVVAASGQCLPCEPPRFSAGGTVGGMVAAGLSGPARASVGALRDFVMGVTLLDGRGEILQFGGQVMKNVAGYDVSRLLAGSWGVLGVLCEVSLKVVPLARATASLCFECDEAQALRAPARLGGASAAAACEQLASWGAARAPRGRRIGGARGTDQARRRAACAACRGALVGFAARPWP